MNVLKTYYKEQADTQPEPTLVPAATAARSKRRLTRVPGLVAASLVFLLAVTAAIPAVRAAVGGWMFNTVTGERQETHAHGSSSYPERAEELLEKYMKDSYNLFVIERAGIHVGNGWASSMRTGKLHGYDDTQDFLNALEGSGFPVPAEFLGTFSAAVWHPLKNDTPVDEWAEDGYIIREYEVDMDVISGWHVDLNNDESFINIRGWLERGWVEVLGESSEIVTVPGWETAVAVYRDDTLMPLSLYLTNPLPDGFILPEYGEHPGNKQKPDSLFYTLSGNDCTLKELIAVAESLN